MPDRLTPRPMQGDGFYNAHSQAQHLADRLGLAAVRRAAAAVPVPADGRPFTVADLGCSHGANSLEPMANIVETVRGRTRAPLAIHHTDLPGNDFSALFTLLETSPRSYLSAPDVFAYAAGRSFFEPLFPAGALHLGWASCAFHWLSQSPCPETDHLWPPLASPAVRGAYARQAASDWARLLDLRARELVPGGRIVVITAQSDPQGNSGGEPLFDALDAAAREMVAGGALSPAEKARMQVVCRFRTEAEWRTTGPLALESYSAELLEWPYFAAFRETGDAGTLARDTAGWLRAWTGPGLEAALDPARPGPERRRLADDLFERLTARVEREPEIGDYRCTTVVMTLVRPEA